MARISQEIGADGESFVEAKIRRLFPGCRIYRPGEDFGEDRALEIPVPDQEYLRMDLQIKTTLGTKNTISVTRDNLRRWAHSERSTYIVVCVLDRDYRERLEGGIDRLYVLNAKSLLRRLPDSGSRRCRVIVPLGNRLNLAMASLLFAAEWCRRQARELRSGFDRVLPLREEMNKLMTVIYRGGPMRPDLDRIAAERDRYRTSHELYAIGLFVGACDILSQGRGLFEQGARSGLALATEALGPEICGFLFSAPLRQWVKTGSYMSANQGGSFTRRFALPSRESFPSYIRCCIYLAIKSMLALGVVVEFVDRHELKERMEHLWVDTGRILRSSFMGNVESWSATVEGGVAARRSREYLSDMRGVSAAGTQAPAMLKELLLGDVSDADLTLSPDLLDALPPEDLLFSWPRELWGPFRGRLMSV